MSETSERPSAAPGPARPGSVDVAVVGAGIVGLATAYRILQEHPRLRLVLLEKEPTIAAHQSGRNSGVLHSGVYYAPGSLKARLAREGRAAMLRFCAEQGVETRLCGKVIVATLPHELDRLRVLADRATANQVRAEWIDPSRLAELEPHAAGLAALHVPEAGIVDYPGVCRALLAAVRAAGGEVALATAVRSVTERDDSIYIGTEAGDWRARVLVNCAGLHSDRVAELEAPIVDGTHIVPFRGEYYALRAARRHLCRGLIYPVPDPAFPFLGVHLTTTLAGPVLAGPNAVLALAREGYRWRDVDGKQVLSLLVDRGLWRLAARYWRTGAGEVWRSLSKGAFARALQRLVPEVAAADLEPYKAGVRAQALLPDGSMVDDFSLVSKRRTLHVLNAPSPAATASLEIGRTLAAECLARLG
jgi:(S)-2-hydroxyglutarate dehydrogenase